MSTISPRRLLLLLLFFTGVLHAAPTKDIRELKAAFLYQFSRYTTWETKPEKAFTIGIQGDDKVLALLRKSLKDKKHDELPYRVVDISLDEGAADCQIIYLGNVTAAELKKFSTALKHPVLLVTHGKDLASCGAGLNFYLADRKLKFEANPATLKKHRVKLSAQLLKLAKVVK